MPRDPETIAHQEWIGYVQPVGLVVSIPALTSAQAYVNRNIAPQQQKLLAILPRDARDEPIPEIRDFPLFTREVLGWEPDDLITCQLPVAEPTDHCPPTTAHHQLPTDDCQLTTDDHQLPTDNLIIALPEYNDTLQPTYAVKEIDPKDGGNPWLMLVQVIATGADFDKIATEDSRHWQATPHHRFERLLRETEVPIGLLVNGTHLRLVYAPRGETSGYATFPVAHMTQVAGRPIFAALHMLLCAERVFGFGLANPEKQCLAGILADSRKYQNVVSTQLAEQVLAALYELVRGFQGADDQRHGELLREILADDPNHVYAGLLTVLMRLVFVLYAEDRDLLSNDPVYGNFYSVTGLFERLRADAGRHPDTMDQRYGAWAQLLTLFRLIHEGGSHAGLSIPARHGYLFDPDRFNFLEGRTSVVSRQLSVAGTTDNCPLTTDNCLPPVSDGVIYRVLNNLLILDGERLSYRTLDVEQIGSVYETMMGFNLSVAEGLSIAIKPTKSHGAPTTINLEALLAAKSAARAKWLVEQTGQKVTGQALDALKKADSVDGLLAALEKKIAWHATPSVVPKAAMVLQPSDERRRSGSHYTPRSLTEPIVRTTVKPVLDRLRTSVVSGQSSVEKPATSHGQRTTDNCPTPQQLLDLKICDPAMGSGAFLVETCRQLGDELVKAWHVHDQVPKLPPDEDEVLHARRVIAQRCLYGVDKNPMAVDLAKLSLWLATLAKGHPFTFLDHALRPGDSLVGLTQEQIAGFHWSPKKQRDLFRKQIEDRMKRVTRYRQEILAARDQAPYEQLRGRLDLADEQLALARLAGNVIVSAFFAADTDRKRQARLDELEVQMTAYLSPQGKMEDRQPLAAAVKNLLTGERPIQPFHWWIEFPEVFSRENGGFDAIVGNPPFAGRTTLSEANRSGYIDWLKTIHEESHGNADLVAHFFRRGFDLLRDRGAFGLIATNTIGQGDTRSTGLRWICNHGATIYEATRRMKWPGLAAVVVSVVHIRKGPVPGPYLLDGRPVPLITAYMFHAGSHDDPEKLLANAGKSFQGSVVVGMGFTFDDTDNDGAASPLAEMERLIAQDSRNAERIFPYIGGEEVNNSPTHAHHRYIINFGEMSEEEARRWPELMKVIEERVKPEREASLKTWSKDKAKRAELWWQYSRNAKDLHDAIHGLDRVLVISRVGQQGAFAFLPAGMVYSEATIVFADSTYRFFTLLQSRPHEVWARFFASSLKDDLRYTPSDCFETFPFPRGVLEVGSGASEPGSSSHAPPATLHALESAGCAYYEFRASLMIRNNEGLTKTYNRFHDPSETSPDIVKLRELHAALDRAVLEAYGWHDLAETATCEFLLDYEDEEDDEDGKTSRRKKPWRYRWPDDFRGEVLARLLALNQERAQQEALAGKAAEAKAKPTTRKRTPRKGKADDGRPLLK